jgi:CheY-like chemotaxis protein
MTIALDGTTWLPTEIALFATEDANSHAGTLKRSGYNVATASTIDDVLRQLETMPDLPRVIILDIPLRRSGDLDALRRLRTNRHSASIPIVRLDRSNTADVPSETFAAFLPASVSATELLSELARLTRPA